MASSYVEWIGEQVLGLLESLQRALLRAFELFQRADRQRVYPFFEKRGVELKDYSMLKLQASSALFMLLTALYIVGSLGGKGYVPLATALILYTLHLLYSDVKAMFQDFNAYRDFFLAYHLLALMLAGIKPWKPVVNFWFPLLHFALIAALGAAVIYLYFTRRYGRDYTYGRVVETKGLDVEVKLNYDICSNVKPQLALLRNTHNAREGDRVKIRVRKGLFSLRGADPVEIIGVEWS